MTPAELATRELFDDLQGLGVTGVIVFPGTMAVPFDSRLEDRLGEISAFGESFIDGRAS